MSTRFTAPYLGLLFAGTFGASAQQARVVELAHLGDNLAPFRQCLALLDGDPTVFCFTAHHARPRPCLPLYAGPQ